MSSTFGFRKATNHQYITDLVVYLFDITKNNREEMDRYLSTSIAEMRKTDYINQYCTMTIGSARGSGHSTSIFNLIEKRELKTIIITDTTREAKRKEWECHAKSDGINLDYPTIADKMLVNVYQADQFIQKYRGLHGVISDLVVFDQTFMFSSGSIFKVKETIIDTHMNPLPFFLFVQPKL